MGNAVVFSAQMEVLSLFPDLVFLTPRYDRGASAPGPGHHVRLRLPLLPPPQLPGLLADPPPLHPALHVGEGFSL